MRRNPSASHCVKNESLLTYSPISLVFLMGAQVVKIGRVPDNTVVIDNPAVSSHHARIFRDADNFILEDLQSTNGTQVNGTLVSRHTLKNGDVIGIGKHTLMFQKADKEEVAAAEAAPSAEEPLLPELGGTVFLDTKAQRELMAKVVAANNVVITTAAIPGKKAPILVTAEMVAGMAPGSVIVDLAAERGGNCELTKPGETVVVNGVAILGPVNLPSSIPYHASEMHSKNISTFVQQMVSKG